MPKAQKRRRLTRLIELLRDSPRGHTVVTLAQELGVPLQTVYRYLADLRDLGITLESDEQHRYRLGSDSVHPSLSNEEVVALVTAVQAVANLTPTARRALEKLGSIQRGSLYDPYLHFHTFDQVDEQVFHTLHRAAREKRTVEFDYTPAFKERGTVRHRFDPYGIVHRDGHYYLVGHNHRADKVLWLRLDQIHHVRLSTTRFRRPAFDLAEHASHSFGSIDQGEPVDVTVWFSKVKARAIARTKRHESQWVEQQPDGSLLYHLRVPVTADLVWWVVGYGGHARVVEPAELRELVIGHARAVLGVYQQDSQKGEKAAEYDEQWLTGGKRQ
ncbi:MAG: WYL domain-containing protein [Deinococcus sp.]|nr:WYL domain-containing protein [Deinococcus sp.]